MERVSCPVEAFDEVYFSLLEPFVTDNGEEHDVLAHALVGDHLWVVYEVHDTHGVRHDLRLHILIWKDGWRHVSYGEAEHPRYTSCPLEFLRMVPESCPAWREEVHRYHRRRLVLECLTN